jgi:hypothetical protein
MDHPHWFYHRQRLVTLRPIGSEGIGSLIDQELFAYLVFPYDVKLLRVDRYVAGYLNVGLSKRGVYPTRD